MVDEHAASLGGEQRLLHHVHPAGHVEIEAEHKVGDGQQHVALLLVLVVADNLLSVWQPRQEVGIEVWNNHLYVLALRQQVLCPSKAGAYGVAVGVGVAGDDYVLAFAYKLLELVELLFVKQVVKHSCE